MKNVYRAMRPSWSEMDRSETAIIFSISVSFTVYALLTNLLVDHLLRTYPFINATTLHLLWSIIDLLVFTAGSLLVMRLYKKLRIGCYPTTFLYCFILPETSNPSGKSLVLGYFHVRPLEEAAQIEVRGASFFWESGDLDKESRVGFTSTNVKGSKEDDETTCDIRFSINVVDRHKRNYHHGQLVFRIDRTSGMAQVAGRDTYAGYLHSLQSDTSMVDADVRSKGFAERHSHTLLNEEEVQAVLQKRGDTLITTLENMLRAKPLPSLWEGMMEPSARQVNFWGLQIPTPQSVVLDQDIWPAIDRLLTQVLSLAGLDYSAIRKFKKHLTDKATLDLDDTRVAYERDLKRGLVGLVRKGRINAALNSRARIIHDQILPYIEGESLLDIGCGNGMIAHLLRGAFKRILLLDVVEYLPAELGFEFKTYKDGETLPIHESFDTVLLLTVLHHSYNPVELLKLAWGATRKKLIIIESVVGIQSVDPNIKYDLVNATAEHQIAYAAFIDWFYNRVLHDDVPVPYNFTTPAKWGAVFGENDMRPLKTIHLGQDIEIGPEYHIMFVLQKG